jgi:hypothetical protein
MIVNPRMNLDFSMPVCYNGGNIVDYSVARVTRLAKGGGATADLTRGLESRFGVHKTID